MELELPKLKMQSCKRNTITVYGNHFCFFS
uniref:Uncharacterized protein n=1 Tax=Arundo donax TaxID=35708 RepID=A0A0A8Z770_ARUDO